MSNSQNRLSDAVGNPKVNVSLNHIERSLNAIRESTLSFYPSDRSDNERLHWMDMLSFDEVMLAATLVATVEALDDSHGVCGFLFPLIAEGVGGRYVLKTIYGIDNAPDADELARYAEAKAAADAKREARTKSVAVETLAQAA